MLPYLLEDWYAGKPCPEIDAAPRLYADLEPAMQAWRTARRQFGADERLPMAEIASTLDAFGIVDDRRGEYVGHFLALEEVLDEGREKRRSRNAHIRRSN